MYKRIKTIAMLHSEKPEWVEKTRDLAKLLGEGGATEGEKKAFGNIHRRMLKDANIIDKDYMIGFADSEDKDDKNLYMLVFDVESTIDRELEMVKIDGEFYMKEVSKCNK